jgi:phosphate-selective porin OprO/OprP
VLPTPNTEALSQDKAPGTESVTAEKPGSTAEPSEFGGDPAVSITDDSDIGDMRPPPKVPGPDGNPDPTPEDRDSGDGATDQPAVESNVSGEPTALSGDEIAPEIYDSDIDDLLPPPKAPGPDVAPDPIPEDREPGDGATDQPAVESNVSGEPTALSGDEIAPEIYDSDIGDMLPPPKAPGPDVTPDPIPEDRDPGDGATDQQAVESNVSGEPTALSGDEIVPEVYDSDIEDMQAQPETKDTDGGAPGKQADPADSTPKPQTAQAEKHRVLEGEEATIPAPSDGDIDSTTPAGAIDADVATQPAADTTTQAAPAGEKTTPEPQPPVETQEPDPQTDLGARKVAPQPPPAAPPTETRVAKPGVYDSDVEDMLPQTDAEPTAEVPKKIPEASVPTQADPAPAEPAQAEPEPGATIAPEPDPVGRDVAPAKSVDSDPADKATGTDVAPTESRPLPAPPVEAGPDTEPPTEDAIWWQDRWIKPWREDWIVEQEEWGIDGLRYVGRWGLVRMKLGGNIAIDAGDTWQSAELDSLFPGVNGWNTIPRNIRLQLVGNFGPHIFYKAQLEVGSISPGFKDVYVVVQDVPLFSNVRFGKGNQPFSMENLTSSKFNSFMERSLLTALTPGLSFGLMAYDTAFKQRMTWAGGIFYRTATWGDLEFDSSTGSDLTARVTALPYAPSNGRLLHVGFGISNRLYGDTTRFSSAPESRLADVEYVDTGDFEADNASTFNVEGAWQDGPWMLQGEYTRNLVRTKDGERSYAASYFQLSYFVTGESRPYNRASGTFGNLVPKRLYHWGDEPGGALELAVRLSAIDLESGDYQGGSQHNITLGATWYPRHNVRMRFNYINGQVQAVGSSPSSRAKGRVNIVQAGVAFNF